MARHIHVTRLEALTVHARVIRAGHVEHQRGAVPKDMHWITECRDTVEQRVLLAHVVYADVIEADELRAEAIVREPFDAKKLESPECRRPKQVDPLDMPF